MGTAIVKIKMMPASPETNLGKIEEDAKKILEENDAKGANFQQEPIAFGLKAIYVSFMWPEEKELEELEEKFRKIENVQSSEVVDLRRAIG
jgi:translation elongation factor aEF-1 beta